MKTYTLDYTSYINENSDKEQKVMVLSSLKEYLNILKQNPEYARPIFRGASHLIKGSIASFELSNVFNNYEAVLKYVKPRENRTSLTAENPGYDSMWSMWLSNNKTWEKYPSRKIRANICTTNSRYAYNYGDVQIVIPVDNQNTKFGICSDNDLFTSFRFLYEETKLMIKSFCNFFTILLNFVQKEKGEYKFDIYKLFDSYQELLSVLDYLQEYFIEELNKNEDLDIAKLKRCFNDYGMNNDRYINLYKQIMNLIKDTYTLQDYFVDMMSPSYNSFMLSLNTEELLLKIHNNRLVNNEVWFNGDYISLFMESGDYYEKISNDSKLYISLIEEIITNLEKK